MAAAKARAAAKELRVSMGGGSDVEADMAAEELGIKAGDQALIEKNSTTSAGSGNSTTGGEKKSSGISAINFAVPT